MSEEQREKANRLGYDRLKEPPEDVSEEQEEKSTVEGIAGGLRTSALFSFVVFFFSFFVVVFLYIERGEPVTGLEESFRYSLMVCGFSFLAWFFCHAARYCTSSKRFGLDRVSAKRQFLISS